MTEIGRSRAVQSVETARIGHEQFADDEDSARPVVWSDQETRCLLREGHRVHVVVTKDTEDSDPKVEEIYCASPYCDYHDHPTDIEDNVSVDLDDLRGETYSEKSSVAVAEATLYTDFTSDGPDTLGLVDITLEAYTDMMTIPAGDF